MKTPEEIRKAMSYCCMKIMCGKCPYKRSIDEIKCDGLLCYEKLNKDVREYIGQLESTYGQVSKALCGKDSATLEEILEAVNQLKRERDAAIEALRKTDVDCNHCKHECFEDDVPNICHDCIKNCNWEWRGVCAENTEEAT